MSRRTFAARPIAAGCFALGVLTVCVYSGCTSGTAPENRKLTAHDPEFDPERARLTLEDIKPDPPPPPASVLPAMSAPVARRLDRARRLYERNRFTEAAIELEKALRQAPDHPQLHRELAKTLYAAGSIERVRSHLQKALAIDGDDIVTHYLLGRLAFEDGESAEAIAHYRVALKASNADDLDAFVAVTHFRLAQVLNAEHYLTASIEQYRAYQQTVASRAPDAQDEPELTGLTQINGGNAGEPISVAYEKLGEFSSAADALASALADRNVDADATERLARLLARCGRIVEALERARSLMTDTDRAVRLLVSIHERAGHPERVIDDIRAMSEGQPERADLVVALVNVLARFERFDEAERVLIDGINRHPDRQELRWRLCDILTAGRKWHRVLEVAADALRVDAEDHLAARNKALAMADAPDAVEALLDREDGSAADAATAYLLGTLAARVGRTNQAESLFERALDELPSLTPARVPLAAILLDRFAWQQVIDLVSADDEQLKRDSQLQLIAGRAYTGLDDFDKAESHLSAAVRLDRTNIAAPATLAELLRRKGDTLKAIQQYEAIIEVNPLHEASREALFEIYLFEQDRKEDADRQLAELRRLSASPHRIARCAARLDRDPNPFIADWDAYRETLRKAIEQNGPDARTYELLGQSYLLNDEPFDALHAFEQALAIDADDLDIAMGRVLTFGALLEYDKQIEAMRALLARHPNRRAWKRRLLSILLIDHRFDDALAWAREQLDKQGLDDGDIAAYRDGIREALAYTGRDDELIAQLREWRDADRDSAVLWRVLIGNYTRLDRHEEAVSEAEALYRHDSGMEAAEALWRTLIPAKRYDHAQRFLLGLLEDDPENDDLNDWLIETLVAADRPDDALELLDSGALGEQREKRLRTLQRAGRHAEAIKQWTKWMRETESDPRGYNERFLHALRVSLAVAQIVGHQYEDAATNLRRWIDEVESPLAKYEYLTRLSVCHQSLDDRDRALDALARAYDLRDTLRRAGFVAGIDNDYGYSLADAGLRLDEAQGMIRRALAGQPGNGAYLDSYGWVLYKKGAFEEARRWLVKAATRMENGDPVVYDHLGDALWRLGRVDEAADRWDEAIETAQGQVSEDGEPADLKKLLQEVRAKIDAVRKHETPDVAPVAADITHP